MNYPTFKSLLLVPVLLMTQIVVSHSQTKKAPGGVTNGLTHWYRADRNINSSNSEIQTWTDSYGGIVSSRVANVAAPSQKAGASNYFNFNQGINFSNTNQKLVHLTSATLASTTFDLFTVTKEGMSGTRYFNIGTNNTSLSGTNWDHPGLYTNGTIARRTNEFSLVSTGNPGSIAFDSDKPSIMYHQFTNTSLRKGVNGKPLGGVINHTAIGEAKGGHIFGANSGTSTGGDDAGFLGDIGEVIIYGAGTITNYERRKVDSYLAIKYGVTLPDTSSVITSNDVVIWDANRNNSYYKNVAGIVHDVNSDLIQSQSISANPGRQIIIGTTGLADNNASNSVPLQAGQALVWGDNGEARNWNISITKRDDELVNARLATIWKVQNTGNVQTVRVAWPKNISNPYFIQSNDAVFDDTDSWVSMRNNTIQINGISYYYADVTIQDGMYFTLAGFLGAPGGVASSAWYKSDNLDHIYSDNGTVVAKSGEVVYRWNDSNNRDFPLSQTSASARPTYSESVLMNFHPTMTFSGSQSMSYGTTVTTNVIDRNQGTLYAAGVANTLQNAGLVGFYTNMNYPGLGLYNSGNGAYKAWLNTASTSGYQAISTAEIMKTSPIIAGVQWENGKGSGANYLGSKVALNGFSTDYYNTNTVLNVNTSATYRALQVGRDTDLGGWNGQLNEVIVFQNSLTTEEVDKVETYLALKYGTTLANGSRIYRNSRYENIWDPVKNQGFQNNIAGIGRDDKGSLNQKQAWSTQSADQILISTVGLANTNNANNIELNDNQFLIWSDNGLTKAPIVQFTVRPEFNNRFAAIWKVQNTNQVGTVRIAWPASYQNLTFIKSKDSVFTASDEFIRFENKITVNDIEYSYIDTVLEDGDYFTMAAKVFAPGGVIEGLSHWFRADLGVSTNGSDVSQWTDFAMGTVARAINSAPVPKVTTGNATYFNFNPGVNFTTTQQMLGNINVRTLSSLDFDIFTFAKEGNSGTRMFNIGMNNTTMAGSNWDHPGIHTNGTLARRNNLAAGAGVVHGLSAPGGIGTSTTEPTIMYHTFTNTSVRNGRNGSVISSPNTHSAVGEVTGGFIFGANSGPNPPGGDDAGFVGHIGELLVYGKGVLNSEQRNRVESYLAIKYGITLQRGNNYTTSDKSVVWNQVDNDLYHNNIAGIGTDSTSALYQKQSRSQMANSNGQVIMAIDSIYATNQLNPTVIPNGKFLLWGDNGITQAMTNTATTYTEFSYPDRVTYGRRMKRVWKVQNTNIEEVMYMQIPTSMLGTTTLPGDGCANYVALFASDENFENDVQVLPLNMRGNNLEVRHKFNQGYSYFTFAKITPVGPTYIYLPEIEEVTYEFEQNDCINEWTYFNKPQELQYKLIATLGISDTTLQQTRLTITPRGVFYNRPEQRVTKVMSRITTLNWATNTNARMATTAANSLPDTNKIRVYYHIPEVDSTRVLGALTNGWFLYQGNGNELLNDIATDGLLEASKTTLLTPANYGIEGGANYVEFHNIRTLGSIAYISSTESSILPVTFAKVDVRLSEAKPLVEWATTFEFNHQEFIVERSTNTRNWEAIGTVISPVATTNTNLKQYAYHDVQPLDGIVYYRIKQVDNDGTTSYSRIVSIETPKIKSTSLYPNPVTEGILYLKSKRSIENLQVFNTLGAPIEINWKSDSNAIAIHHLPTGIYMLSIRFQDGTTETHSFVVH